MVGSIQPGQTNAALNLSEARAGRPAISPAVGEARQDSDVASIGTQRAAWRAALDNVESGMSAIHLALAAGRQSFATLQDIATAAGEGRDVQGLLDRYTEDLAAARAALLQGGSLDVAAEPGGAPVHVAGGEARLGAGGLAPLPRDAAGWEDGALEKGARKAAEALQKLLTSFETAAAALEKHAAVLRTAESALASHPDLDTEGARLLALQVSQGLASHGREIVQADPGAVLALFRA